MISASSSSIYDFRPSQEQWVLRVKSPESKKSLFIRFATLISSNGFLKTSEVLLEFSAPGESGELQKTLLKQTFDISSFHQSEQDPNDIRMGENVFRTSQTNGKLQCKGKKGSWSLNLQPRTKKDFRYFPENMTRMGVLKETFLSPALSLSVDGEIEIEGVKHRFSDAWGTLEYYESLDVGCEWTRGHAALFTDSQGNAADFLFSGLNLKARWFGWMKVPAVTSFYFRYQEQDYLFNHFWNLIRTRSQPQTTEWKFQADSGNVTFRGTLQSKIKDFFGLATENMKGRYLYQSMTEHAELSIHVYRDGKLENTFQTSLATFEIASFEKNNYVPTLT